MTEPNPAFPDLHPLPELPAKVTVYEVGARDGLQAEKQVIDTTTKVEFINRLTSAGFSAVEATSFVSPRWVPQLADAAEVMGAIDRPERVRLPVLTPNTKGLQRAIDAGAREVAVFVSATESFAKANLASTVAGALDSARRVTSDALAAGLRVRGYVSMCWGDPWEGAVAPATVGEVTAALAEAGCATVSLGDTIGVATAGGVVDVVAACWDAGVENSQLALHFHDTYGQALSNVQAGLRLGVTEYDASAGGLGGCPFAGSATGNLATEDLLWLLQGLGISTGVDLTTVVAATTWLAERMGREPQSAVARALGARRGADSPTGAAATSGDADA